MNRAPRPNRVGSRIRYHAHLPMRNDSNGEIMLVFEGENDEPPELSLDFTSVRNLSQPGRAQPEFGRQ